MASGIVAEPMGQGGGGIHGGGGAAPSSGNGYRGSYPPGLPERIYMTGLMVALCGIAMFFIALASAYVVRKGLAQNDWRTLAVPPILWLNTAILLLSSGTLALAGVRQRRGDCAGFRHWWLVSAILGTLFLAGQLIAWRELAGAGLFLASNPSAGFFYIFTAAHGIHLLGGLLALVGLAIYTPRRLAFETAVRVAAAYWHFLTALWILLLLFLVFAK